MSPIALSEGGPAAPPAPPADTRRGLLFFLSVPESYRQPLFSSNEVFCSPDAFTRESDGRLTSLRTAPGAFDVRDVLSQLPAAQQPDFVVVKADATARNLPRNLSRIAGPKVLLVGDSHHLQQPLQGLIRYALEEPFDFVIFDHTRHHARFFAEAGLRQLHWLPALDYGFEPRQINAGPSRPLTFVGQAGQFHPYRRWVLQQVQMAGLPLEMLRGRLAETADIYADSQVTLNISLNGDLNLRVFEALAAGGFLLTDELSPCSGLRLLFESGRHLETWRTPGELIEKIRHYLAHPDQALRIRRAGQAELFERHRPEVKLREFFGLLDGGAPNPRYDLRREPWWPRLTVMPSINFSRELVAYEALQELHRTAPRVELFATDPAALGRFANLPRLSVRPLGQLGQPAAEAAGPVLSVIWWTGDAPEEALARFGGQVLLAPEEAAAARPELAAWGFAPDEAGSPVLRLVRPLQFLEKAWAAGGRPAIHRRLPPLIEASTVAEDCVAFASYAWQLGDPALQHAALKRAIGLDRNHTGALLALAAMLIDQGDSAAVPVLLEEAGRVGPLPPEVEDLRGKLMARAASQPGLGFYLRAIGRHEAGQAARPRRILVVTNLFPPQELGGYGRMMWEFARGLRRRGHEVLVLAADQPSLAKPPTEDERELESCVRRVLPLLGEWRRGQPIRLEDMPEAMGRARTIFTIVQAEARRFGAEAVLAGNLDFLDIFPVQAALAAGLPVLHALGNQGPGYGTKAQPVSPRYWVGPSSDWNGRVLAQAGYSPARIETLYPGARIDRFFRFFLPDPSPLRICFAGLVLPYKGPHILIDALGRIHRAGVEFTAEIAGDAPDPALLARLQEAVRTVGLADRIRFTGFLDRSGLSALFARSNVLVFPSLVPETFGISQVEAMAAGLAVVSSATGGAREIIRHGEDGLLFSPGKADELARLLLALARDSSLMPRLQRAGQARAVSFGVDASVEKIEGLLEELLGGAPAAGPSDPVAEPASAHALALS